jgi:hypothetical protein
MKTSGMLALALGVLLLMGCEKAKAPSEVNVTYTVHFQGQSRQVVFAGELDKTVTGYCALSDSGDATYTKMMTLRVVRNTGPDDNHELQISRLKMRESPSDEILTCDGVHINFNATYDAAANHVACGSVDEGKCAIRTVVYDKKEKRIEGSFECGEFPTTAMIGTDPVPMSITGGTFMVTHCD